MVARITAPSRNPTMQQMGGAPQPMNPAISAMSGFANAGAGRGMPKVNPNAQAPLDAPFQATQVDTSKQDAIGQGQLDQSNQDRELMTKVGLNTISGLQTRNAENAARMGLQAGGASYLSGQRSAAVAGINAFDQGLQQWGNQRQGILQGQAGLAAGASQTNAANKQSASNANTQYGIDQTKAQQDTKSGYYGNALQDIDARAQEQANIYGKDKSGPLQAKYIADKSAYNKAVSEGNWAEADRLLAELNSLVPARK